MQLDPPKVAISIYTCHLIIQILLSILYFFFLPPFFPPFFFFFFLSSGGGIALIVNTPPTSSWSASGRRLIVSPNSVGVRCATWQRRDLSKFFQTAIVRGDRWPSTVQRMFQDRSKHKRASLFLFRQNKAQPSLL